MIVGVPAEIKTAENRVAMTPDGVRELTAARPPGPGRAGRRGGLVDHRRRLRGRRRPSSSTGPRPGAPSWSSRSRSPSPRSSASARRDLVLFTYLHLAAYPEVAEALLAAGHDRPRLRDGAAARRARCRCWRPMSEVAGRMATQVGAHYLERTTAGGACCSAGRPASGRPGSWCSARATSGGTRRGSPRAWRPRSILLDKNLDRLRWVDQIHQGRIMTLASNRGAVERAVAEADLVIGAVLVAGGRAPMVVTERHGARA